MSVTDEALWVVVAHVTLLRDSVSAKLMSSAVTVQLVLVVTLGLRMRQDASAVTSNATSVQDLGPPTVR